jgi:hypothetical protein
VVKGTRVKAPITRLSSEGLGSAPAPAPAPAMGAGDEKDGGDATAASFAGDGGGLI